MLPGLSYAATRYVSTTGNNSNSGNSWAQAWLTLQYAADQVDAGDSVWIADGNFVGFDLRTTGTASAPIVFIAFGNNASNQYAQSGHHGWHQY